MAAVADAIGAFNVGIRLEPTGMYNGTYRSERVETWSNLYTELASYTSNSKLSYVHFIEPSLDRVEATGDLFHNNWSLPTISNNTFRDIVQAAGIPCFTCGGWDADTASSVVDSKDLDGVAIGKWFVSNPDLPERLRLGKELQPYDRSPFYGSWDGARTNGYTDYLTWQQGEKRKVEEVLETETGKAGTQVVVEEVSTAA